MNIHLSLDALQVLDAIDRRRSFAAAAEELHRVPSAITYTVNKLEEELGVTLFDRSGHRAVLTAAGRELVQEGRHLLQAAVSLENRLKRVATGWETELRIAVGDLVNFGSVLELLEQFCDQGRGTHLRIMSEVFGGLWDALVTDRADLVIGAGADVPPGGGYSILPLGEVEFVFAVAPHHPLADRPEPLSPEDIVGFRAIAAAVTSVGFLPASWIAGDLQSGRLKIKQVQEPRGPGRLVSAWRTRHGGRALEWFRNQLAQKEVCEALLSGARVA
ncbi:MAG: LysR substrate-binding domain-containing protein [Acidiferrobacteraceae bacterium]